MAKERGPNINELLGQPEFNTGVDLLRNREMRIALATGEVRADIVEVEPFSELLDQRYIGPFDRPEEGRRKGEIFVIWPMGKPTLSVVENPDERSIIVLKQFGVHRVRMSLTRLLTDPAHGGMDPEQMRTFVRSLDGLMPGPEADVEFEETRNRAPVEIAHTIREGVPNSWGIIRKKPQRRK